MQDYPAVLGNKVYEELQVTIGMFDMHTIDSQSSFEQSLWALGDAGLGSSRFVVGSGNKEKRVIVLNAESKKRFQLYSLVEYFGLTTVDDGKSSLPKVVFSDFVLPASMHRYLFWECNPTGSTAEEEGERLSAQARGIYLIARPPICLRRTLDARFSGGQAPHGLAEGWEQEAQGRHAGEPDRVDRRRRKAAVGVDYSTGRVCVLLYGRKEVAAPAKKAGKALIIASKPLLAAPSKSAAATPAATAAKGLP